MYNGVLLQCQPEKAKKPIRIVFEEVIESRTISRVQVKFPLITPRNRSTYILGLLDSP